MEGRSAPSSTARERRVGHSDTLMPHFAKVAAPPIDRTKSTWQQQGGAAAPGNAFGPIPPKWKARLSLSNMLLRSRDGYRSGAGERRGSSRGPAKAERTRCPVAGLCDKRPGTPRQAGSINAFAAAPSRGLAGHRDRPASAPRRRIPEATTTSRAAASFRNDPTTTATAVSDIARFRAELMMYCLEEARCADPAVRDSEDDSRGCAWLATAPRHAAAVSDP